MPFGMEGLGQIQQQSLRQVQTLSMRQIQYVKLLQMNTQELNRYLSDLHLENPLVEIESAPQMPDDKNALQIMRWVIDRPVYRSYDDPNDKSEMKENDFGQAQNDEQYNLKDYIKSQFDLSLSKVETAILEQLIDLLDENGYLSSYTTESFRCDSELLEEAIAYLQTLDPPGIGARNLPESLIIQLRRLGVCNPSIITMIQSYLEDLSLGRFQKVAKVLECSTQQVKEYYQIIRELSPKPASGFGEEQAHYILPDITVVERPDKTLTGVYNRHYCTQLTINEEYLRLAQADETAHDYITQKMSQALWVVKAIENRQTTIEKIVMVILDWQKDFFYEPDGSLTPMRLKDVAEPLEVHESTISRAINGKYLQCKRGTFPIKYFFSSALHTAGNEQGILGSRVVKEKIRVLIEEESESHPLTDSDIVKILMKDGMTVARRTVAKYREELRIPSSAVRKKN